MIESVHSSEAGDNSSGRVQASFKMPKNVRQIGKSSPTKKIYVEDYVMTYVKQLVGGDFAKCRVAVLVGQCIKLDSCRNIFISGAVEVKDVDPAADITFSNDSWTGIYEEIKKYFVETEIVGWFIGGAGYLLEDKDKIAKAHIDNFAGQDKVLLTYDNMEKEETFYCFENNRLVKLEGYYIYYEKNEEMQTYMIEHREAVAVSMEVGYEDKVTKNIREVLQNKKDLQEDSKNVTRLMYAAGTLLAVIVLVVGAVMLNNYDQMKSMQDTLNHLTENMEEVQSIFSGTGGSDIDSQTSVIKGQPSDLSDPSAGENSQDGKTGQDSSAENNDSAGKDGAKTGDSTGNDVTAGNNSSGGNSGAAGSELPTGNDSSTENESSSGQGVDVESSPGNVQPAQEDSRDTQEESPGQSNEDKEEQNSSPDEELAAEEDEKDEEKTEEQDKEVVREQVKYYTVKDGDTLADISYKLYHTYTRVQQIMDLNGIKDKDVIYAGQKLIVP